MMEKTRCCVLVLLLPLLAAASCDMRDLAPMEPDTTLDSVPEDGADGDSTVADVEEDDGGGEDASVEDTDGDVLDAVEDGSGSDGVEAVWPSGKYISCDEVHALMEAGDPDMLLLLVSDEEFWSMGMIEGSVVIPWDLLAGRLDEVDSSRNVVAYCRRGVRSEAAYTTLTDSGHEHVWVMSNGLEEWISLGYPVVDVP